IESQHGTIFLATPSLLLLYLRKMKPELLKSLRLLMVGAEKLKPSLAEAWHKRFGLTPLEGYGATELSPVIALNVPDWRLGSEAQIGTKPGTVGHPLPGVTIRIVDPDTFKRVPDGQDGLILVRGANRMKGYLNEPVRTAAAIVNDFYNTGDIGHID